MAQEVSSARATVAEARVRAAERGECIACILGFPPRSSEAGADSELAKRMSHDSESLRDQAISDLREAEEELQRRGELLVQACSAALPGWLHSQVLARASGADLDADHLLKVVEAASGSVLEDLQRLLNTPASGQRGTPLNVLRSVAEAPTALLTSAGVAPPQRDPFELERFPEDRYGLAPVAWADLGEEVGEAGLGWGAARALVHLVERQVLDLGHEPQSRRM